MATDIQLHGFCDASNMAYAAVVYCRVPKNWNYRIEILASKTSVAPFKRVSLPNLKLCGATLLANLLTKVAFLMMVEQVTSFAWTDSTIVSDSHKQTFVAYRISTILDFVKSDQLNHVRSSENPADVASRGICPSQLQNHNLWWHGPKWLKAPQASWARYRSTKKDTDTQGAIWSNISTVKQDELTSTFEKYSSINKLLRVIAYCLRFATNCRNQNANRPLRNYCKVAQYIFECNVTESKLCWSDGSKRCRWSNEIDKISQNKYI